MDLGAVGRLGRRPGRGRRARNATMLGAGSAARRIDGTLLLSALMLTGFGNLAVYSASAARLRADGLPERYLVNRQITFSIVGIIAMTIIASFSYRRLKAWAPAVYGGSIIALLLVLTPIGSAASGAQRWINIGLFQFQPAEFAKVGCLVAVALLLAEQRGYPGVPDILRAIALVAPPMLLIFMQPDLGTMLVLVALFLTLVVVSGTQLRLLLAMLGLGIMTVIGALRLGVLHEYQLARLTAFMDQSADPLAAGYNLNQARIAVGSGRVLGKGLFTGTQTNLDFVPEVHTDFIFTAIAEELGFVGAVVLLGLFAVFLYRGMRIAMLSKDLFGTLLAAGVVGIVAFQMFVNIGMTIGVSPVTGIPLPFVSYGGSSMVTTFVLTGILLSVHMRRV